MAEGGGDLIKLFFSTLAGGIAGHCAARRTQRDASIKNLTETVAEIAATAEEYWCVDGTEPSGERLARRLKAKLQDVVRSIVRLGRNYPTYRFSGHKKIIAFRQAITGGQFDVANRSSEIDRIDQIHIAAAELRDEIYDSSCYFWQVPAKTWIQFFLKLTRRR